MAKNQDSRYDWPHKGIVVFTADTRPIRGRFYRFSRIGKVVEFIGEAPDSEWQEAPVRPVNRFFPVPGRRYQCFLRRSRNIVIADPVVHGGEEWLTGKHVEENVVVEKDEGGELVAWHPGTGQRISLRKLTELTPGRHHLWLIPPREVTWWLAVPERLALERSLEELEAEAEVDEEGERVTEFDPLKAPGLSFWVLLPSGRWDLEEFSPPALFALVDPRAVGQGEVSRIAQERRAVALSLFAPDSQRQETTRFSSERREQMLRDQLAAIARAEEWLRRYVEQTMPLRDRELSAQMFEGIEGVNDPEALVRALREQGVGNLSAILSVTESRLRRLRLGGAAVVVKKRWKGIIETLSARIQENSGEEKN